jgi:hypothetical protein
VYVRHPGKWSEASFDFKLLLIHHGVTFVLFMLGERLPVRAQLRIWIVLVSILITLSVRHRRQINWHWPGAGRVNYLQAIALMIAGALSLSASVPLFPPMSPHSLPWYLGGLGLLLFGVAATLRITSTWESDFLPSAADVGEPSSSEQAIAPAPRDWRFWLRTGFVVFVVAVWLDGTAFHYISGRTYRDGSPSPTVTKTERLDRDGRVVYVTPSEKVLFDRLKAGVTFGIPAALLLGLLLHYVLKVDIHPRKAIEPRRRS